MLPHDLNVSLSRTIVYANRYVNIENYIKVIEYSTNLIRIKTKENTLKIQGDNLEIKYINSDEISIVGIIHSIEYWI